MVISFNLFMDTNIIVEVFLIQDDEKIFKGSWAGVMKSSYIEYFSAFDQCDLEVECISYARSSRGFTFDLLIITYQCLYIVR
jgi:hypothetical protein